MSVKPIIVKNYNMHNLMPLVEIWLSDKGFSVSIVANKIEGFKKTGFFSSMEVVLFFEDYPEGCVIRPVGFPSELYEQLNEYVKSLPPKELKEDTIIKEREVIQKEVVLIKCSYCGSMMQQTDLFCRHCGAKR